MRGQTTVALFAACALLLPGCGALQGLERMQCTMDRMSYYMSIMASNMPVMAQSTHRMAQNTERMMGKTDTMIANLQQKGVTGERAIQNYAQAVIDNDRAMIDALKAIRKELGSFKEELRGSGIRPPPDQAKIREMESRVEAISARLKELEKKAQ